MTIRISQPLRTLLDRAGISPRKLNAILEERLLGRRGALRYTDAIPRAVMRASGVEIDFICRRNRSILFEVNDLQFIYRERSRLDCCITIPQVIPETVALGCVGLPLEAIVDLGDVATFLRGAIIGGPVDSWEGSTSFSIRSACETIPL